MNKKIASTCSLAGSMHNGIKCANVVIVMLSEFFIFYVVTVVLEDIKV
jgi:hypothetical protein